MLEYFDRLKQLQRAGHSATPTQFTWLVATVELLMHFREREQEVIQDAFEEAQRIVDAAREIH